MVNKGSSTGQLAGVGIPVSRLRNMQPCLHFLRLRTRGGIIKKIIILLIIPLIISCTYSNHKPYTVNDTIPFSSTKWKTGDMYLKGIMVNDLLKNQRLIGLKRIEIFKLLGRPTGFQNQSFDPQTPAEQDTINPLCYFAFPPYLSEYQPYALMCIHFDSLDKVESIGITD